MGEYGEQKSRTNLVQLTMEIKTYFELAVGVCPEYSFPIEQMENNY